MLQVIPRPTLVDRAGQASNTNWAFTAMEDMDEKAIAAVFNKPAYQELIASDAFQRLKDIQFLGAIDYVVTIGGRPPKKRHTRFQHSLRVGQLAIQYSHLCNLHEPDETLLVVSALLHDVGHAPLSHSLERTFKEKFGLSHHHASEMIIRGTVPIARQLPRIFKKYRIHYEEVLALINSTSSAPYVHAFRNPINIDTIEAITRTYSYISKSSTGPQPARIVLALVRKSEADVDLMDEFWQLKDVVYTRLITSKIGLLADYVCQQYMQEHPNLWKGLYFHSEIEFRKKHGDLFDRLRKLKMSNFPAFLEKGLRVPYQQRRFIVDRTVPVRRDEDLYKRYTQTREDAVLEFDS